MGALLPAALSGLAGTGEAPASKEAGNHGKWRRTQSSGPGGTGKSRPDKREMPPEVDFSRPSVARMYDYYLGGKDNSAADREAARLVLGAAPDVLLAALENREFLKRVVAFLVQERGVSQFVDIGPGLPTQGNVHQLARQHAPAAQVVYADNDATVLAHGRALLDGVRGVDIVHGDLREPDRILSEGKLAALIDFSRPVALFMTLVLHFVPPNDEPHRAVARLRDALCPGSFLVLSHVTGDGREAGSLTGIDAYENANAPLILRTREQVGEFFVGFELIEPGIVFLSQWRPTGEYHAQGGTRWAYCGVGEKP
jgi:SAM-dependent methyltransferase